MKIKFFLFYFLISSLSYAHEVVELAPNIDNYAIKNVLSSVEREALPRVETLGEAFSLAKATLNSELGFWEDVKEQMRDENKRLNAIVGIIGSRPLSLDLRLQLFTYQRKHADTEEEYAKITESREFDYYMYTAYKNLDKLSKYIEKLQDIISSAETEKFLKKKQTQTFRSVKYYVSTRFAEIIQQCKAQRSLFTTSSVKSINRLIQDHQNNNSSLDLDVAIEDISAIIVPVFEEPQKKSIPSSRSGKKSKKSKKKHAYASKSAKPNGNRGQLDEASSSSSVAVASEVVPITIDPTVTEAVIDPNPEIKAEMQQLQLNDLPKQDELVEEDVFGEDEVYYMSEAQAAALSAYQPYQKTKVSKVETLLEVAQSRPQLSFEQEVVVKTLLGLGKAYAQLPVRMADFIDVIITLGGHVVRNKKNVHFIIPSWKGDGIWFSKAMHPLHKDDKGIIPRNTKYYWDRAQNLFLEADVAALL